MIMWLANVDRKGRLPRGEKATRVMFEYRKPLPRVGYRRFAVALALLVTLALSGTLAGGHSHAGSAEAGSACAICVSTNHAAASGASAVLLPIFFSAQATSLPVHELAGARNDDGVPRPPRAPPSTVLHIG